MGETLPEPAPQQRSRRPPQDEVGAVSTRDEFDTSGGARDRAAFWQENQPGFRFTSAAPGSERFFEDVRLHRYTVEPHIHEVVQFPKWGGRDVLEAGCGIATDGSQFAQAGARYTGLDASEDALSLARRRFDLLGLDGVLTLGSITDLPFDDGQFDLVYSHGVIHHVPDTQRAINEFYRVLRPGGTVLIMVYHRKSFNYMFSILTLRRLLAGLLLIPGAPRVAARVTTELPVTVAGHRELLRQHGIRYLCDKQLFLSNNTDGPGNPLSKVYDDRTVRGMFDAFSDLETCVRYLNLRLYPLGNRIAATKIGRRLERRVGWHLYITGVKPG